MFNELLLIFLNFLGYSSIVLKPKTTEEVSNILKFCNKEKLAICPQGGNTGLVGGSVPVFDEVILSMSLMNKIIAINELSGILKEIVVMNIYLFVTSPFLK